MPSSGSGTGTPISGGLPAGGLQAYPLPYTLLSLPRYARLMGLNPVHFYRAAAPGLNPAVMPVDACDDLWAKYDWQNADRVSWHQLAQEIAGAEEEIANALGFWPAPVWSVNETHLYPRHFNRRAWDGGFDLRGKFKRIAATWGRVRDVGRRAVSLIGSATVAGGSLVYSDQDGDGLFETATVSLPTTLGDLREIKVYFSGAAGATEWEVRSPRRVTLSGGVVTFTYDAWQLIEPALYDDLPGDAGLDVIDISTVANYVTTVDVYREYAVADNTAPAVTFYWEPNGIDCLDVNGPCTDLTQNGCLAIADDKLGLLTPTPASYVIADDGSGAWTAALWAGSREPDRVQICYRSGAVDPAFNAGSSHEPLSAYLAEAVAWLATARLERPLCGCGAAKDRADDWRIDLTYHTSGASHFVTADVYTCPFGTRKGEVFAWRRIKRLVKEKRMGVAVI
jgi:hypothetical protein